jgi:hypothetical protein
MLCWFTTLNFSFVEESMNERSNDGYTAPKKQNLRQVSNSEGKADGMSCIVWLPKR